MRTHPRLRIILSTDELMEEYQQAENIFGLFRTSLKEVVEYCVDYWMDYPHTWGSHEFTAFDQLREFMEADFLRDIPYNPHTEEERQIFFTLINRVGVVVFLDVIPVIEMMRLPEAVRLSLRCDGWIGNSLIVSTLGKPGFGISHLYASLPRPPRPSHTDSLLAQKVHGNVGVTEQHPRRLAALRRERGDFYLLPRCLPAIQESK